MTPSISLGVSPASAMASLAASSNKARSVLPELREYSVSPIPAMTAFLLISDIRTLPELVYVWNCQFQPMLAQYGRTTRAYSRFWKAVNQLATKVSSLFRYEFALSGQHPYPLSLMATRARPRRPWRRTHSPLGCQPMGRNHCLLAMRRT